MGIVTVAAFSLAAVSAAVFDCKLDGGDGGRVVLTVPKWQKTTVVGIERHPQQGQTSYGKIDEAWISSNESGIQISWQGAIVQGAIRTVSPSLTVYEETVWVADPPAIRNAGTCKVALHKKIPAWLKPKAKV